MKEIKNFVTQGVTPATTRLVPAVVTRDLQGGACGSAQGPTLAFHANGGSAPPATRRSVAQRVQI
jgi:hypothetical protein